MKFTRSLAFAAIATAVGIPTASFAADGTITFNGTITPQTCTISGEGAGPNFTVTLPTVSTSALAIDGTPAGGTPFTIALTNCSPDSGTAQTYFEPGPTVDTATGRLRNATGTASNVEVGLLNDDYSLIHLGAAQTSQNSKSAAISGGSALLKYIAQYVATGGAAGAGSVNTTTLYSIVYQ
ncbi:MAG TPA: fimbrial protein [Paraburkholderia sp.]|jgi:major type 1 subunit fimbrin (pilin)|nr:fimbrial protein [Paraburkholderia sp.]